MRAQPLERADLFLDVRQPRRNFCLGRLRQQLG
jgi:hypothetical protein